MTFCGRKRAWPKFGSVLKTPSSPNGCAGSLPVSKKPVIADEGVSIRIQRVERFRHAGESTTGRLSISQSAGRAIDRVGALGEMEIPRRRASVSATPFGDRRVQGKLNPGC